MVGIMLGFHCLWTGFRGFAAVDGDCPTDGISGRFLGTFHMETVCERSHPRVRKSRQLNGLCFSPESTLYWAGRELQLD